MSNVSRALRPIGRIHDAPFQPLDGSDRRNQSLLIKEIGDSRLGALRASFGLHFPTILVLVPSLQLWLPIGERTGVK